MNKLGILAGLGAVAVAATMTAGSALAAAPKPVPKAGAACAKAGATATAGKKKLVCTKMGKKLMWMAPKAAPAGTKTTASGPSTSVNWSFSGLAQVKQSGSNLEIKADAQGGGDGIGTSAHLTGEGQGNSDAKPCPVFTGPGAIEAGGDKVSFTVDQKSSGCPDADDQNLIIVTGNAAVAGGGGKFAKAKGTLRFAGTWKRETGELKLQFTGSLTL